MKKMGLMKEIGELQTKYQDLINEGRLTKKSMCDLIIPFRDKHGLTDRQALLIARGKMSIQQISILLDGGN